MLRRAGALQLGRDAVGEGLAQLDAPLIEAVDEPMNLILVAGEGAAPAKQVLLDRWRALRTRSKRAVDLTKAISDRYETTVPTRDVPVLTDDYAPTDALLFVD